MSHPPDTITIRKKEEVMGTNTNTDKVRAAMRERSRQFDAEGVRASVVVRHTFEGGKHTENVTVRD